MAGTQEVKVDCHVQGTNDWQAELSVLECNRHMFEQQVDCDVHFMCGEGRDKVGAHRYVLTSRSSVFYAMFRGPLAEEEEEIAVPDIEVEDFTELLRYIYYEEIKLDSPSVIAVLYAAKKYNVRRLVKLCTDHLESSVDVDNACVILEQAHHFSEGGLQRKVLNFIYVNANTVFNTPEFCQLCIECVQRILASDELRISDDKVLKGILQWAEADCARKHLEPTDTNKRSVMGGLLYHIRFPLLEPKYFVQEMNSSALLTDTEKVAILSYYIDNSVPVDMFCTRKRKEMEFWKSVRFQGIDHNHWSCHSGTDAISFTVNHDLLLCGFMIYRARRTELLQTLHVQVVLYSEDRVLLRQTQDIDTARNPDVCDVFLKSSVQLRGDCQYNLEVTTRGSSCISGIKGRTTVSKGKYTVVFKNSEKSTIGTNIHKGQIPGLILSCLDT